MKKLGILIIFILVSSASYAWVSDIGLDPLDQTGGARPLGMGSAFIAVSDDNNAIFYNPAGLTSTRGFTASLQGIKNFSLGIAYNTPAGSVGLGMVSKILEKMDYDNSKANFETSMFVAGFAMGTREASFGISVKSMLYERFTLTGMSDLSPRSSYDIDAGLLIRPLNYLSLGLVMHNIFNSPYTLGSSDEVYPRSTKIGFAYQLFGKDAVYERDDFGVKIAYDIELGEAGESAKQNSYYGVECSYNNYLFLRMGGSSVLAFQQNVNSVSLGFGIKIKETELQYASLKDPFTDTQVSYVSIMYIPEKFEIFQQPKAKARPSEPVKRTEKDLLVISSPMDDTVTYGGSISIEGETAPKASVQINGVYVYVGPDGRFKAVQSLNSGKNLIEIQAKSGADFKVITKKVLRKAKVTLTEEEGLNKKIVADVLNKESEIYKKQKKIAADKAKGINVSIREKALEKERAAYEARKSELYIQKTRIDERKSKVENLATLGVIDVSPTKSFAIEAVIKRGEMISWLVKSSGMTVMKVEAPVFIDVPAAYEYAPYIKAAYDAGMIARPADDRFRPDDPVTEEEGQQFFKAFGIIK